MVLGDLSEGTKGVVTHMLGTATPEKEAWKVGVKKSEVRAEKAKREV